jgi:hypothetical protein
MSLSESQEKFIEKMLVSLRRVVQACAEQGGKAALLLGRKQVGDHTIRVSVVAEREKSFRAPLQNYSEKSLSNAALKTPDGQANESITEDADGDNQTQTLHRNHKRTSRWQKPVF